MSEKPPVFDQQASDMRQSIRDDLAVWERSVAGKGIKRVCAAPTLSRTEGRKVMAEECGNCRFWAKLTNPSGDLGGGFCRRYPPAFMLENTLNDGWPNVHEKEWCGEFQAAPQQKGEG